MEDSFTAHGRIDWAPRTIGTNERTNERTTAPPPRVGDVLEKDVTEKDVLRTAVEGDRSTHPGNQRFYLFIVADNKIEYKKQPTTAWKSSKPFPMNIVKGILEQVGHFLKKEKKVHILGESWHCEQKKGGQSNRECLRERYEM